MFGFPIGNGNSGAPNFVEKFTNNADSGFPKIQQREVFYSIKDGLWADATIWQTASGRVGLLPTSIDDVYVRHNVSLDQTANSYNLYIPSYASIRHNGATSTNRILNVFGDFLCDGTINVNIGLANTITLNLYGTQNRLATYIATTNSFTINYVRSGEQDLMPIIYDNLGIYNGIKYARSNVVANSGLFGGVGAVFELGQYDLDCGVLGNAAVTFDATLSKQAQGNILFRGTVAPRTNARLLFQGNPIVEFRNGIGIDALSFGQVVSGNGPWYFTTNNQSIRGTNITIDAPVIIASGITLSIGNLFSTTVTLSNTINGTDGTSNLLMHLNGILNFTTQVAAEGSMAIGTWNFTTNLNTIGYTGNYSATIPSYFTTFHHLIISGTGTKTLSTNTTLNGNLTLNTTGGILECSTYNLTVSGTTNFQNGGLNKSGAGNLLFIGAFISATGYSTNKISFTGNPNVEFRGGITQGNYVWNGGWNTGTGTWTFSTNNQTLQGSYSGLYPMPFTCKIIVSGAISLTFTSGAGATFADKIDGTVAGSTWINQGRMRFIGTEITPMVTGVFNYLTSTSSFLLYEYSGNQTIPYTSYQGFGVAGTGTKTLSGNTTVSQNFEFNDNVSHRLECSTYNFTVSGSSFVNGIIGKTGPGNLLFIGGLTWGGTSGVGNQGGFDLSGNPTLEFRGGIGYGTYGMNAATNTGTGTITFSTNNQTVQLGRVSGANITLNNNILISGAITVTLNNSTTNTLLAGSINGDNASSTLRIAANATTNYHSATQPMATGILDTSTNLNTWIYGLNNQNIKGGPTTLAKQVYRNLTLNGTGVKTLQGYVSVQNTYTLTAPATLALNGYTLTNP